MEEKDFKRLTKKRYFFNWKDLKGSADIYKLHLKEEDDILGVMGLVNVPEEKRIEIKLLAVSIENKGRNKIYDRVAGCLIGFACDRSAKKYELEACVSLVPKTQLITPYMLKYQMRWGGQLFLGDKALYNIIAEYL